MVMTPAPFHLPTTSRFKTHNPRKKLGLGEETPKGYNEHLLDDGVRLLLDVPWSTVQVEQGHASLAAMSKLHRDCKRSLLMIRSFLHQARALFVGHNDIVLERLHSQLDKAKKRQAQKVSGRHVFLKHLYQSVRKEQHAAWSMSKDSRLKIMRAHASHYKALAPEMRAGFEREAQALRSQILREQHNEVEALNSTITLHCTRIEASERVSHPLRLAACAYNDEICDDIVCKAASCKLSRDALYKTLTTHRPQPPPPAEVGLRQSLPSTGFVPEFSADMPPWAHVVARCREQFHNVAILKAHGEQMHAYIPLWITKKPH